MKTIDIFCASQAAITTMNSNIDDHHHHPSSSNGGRAIDRHNPIIQDGKRVTKTLPILPSNTQTNNNKNKSRKLKKNDQKNKNIAFADENSTDQQVIMKQNNFVVKKQASHVLLGWGCTRPGDFISPATSSRFLLADKALSDQFDPLLMKQVSTSPALPPPPPPPSQPLSQKIDIYDGDKSFRKNDNGNHTSSPVKSLPPSSDQQVVVLRVSLHCKGCEKKMRKHISKMEGVASFNIDFMAKKVTVIGDVTPLGVLASVSKVKNAKLLTPTTISSSTVPQMDSSFSEIKKQLGLVA